MPPHKDFKVAIVGGSIAGLSLANMLEKFGIDYVLLDAYPVIAPQVGASIGMMPNGLRILDQIGCYEPFAALMKERSQGANVRVSDGSVVTTVEYLWDHMEQRHGYPLAFADRQSLLEVLYQHLQHKDRVHVGKRVANITMDGSGVEVTTEDGSNYFADIVVGADGVHSVVRAEMRRIADQVDLSYFKGDETSRVPVTHNCLFGISRHTEGYPKMTENFVWNQDFSHFLVPGPEGRIYWFLFVNTGKAVYGKDIPRFTKDDEMALVEQHKKDRLTETLTFGDLYSNRISSVLVPLQEHVYKRWHFQRIITIGDAAHKQNPIGGQGGNQAIESAAALVNYLLNKMDARPGGLDSNDIADVFEKTQAARRDTTELMMKKAIETQKVHAQENLASKMILRTVVPIAGGEATISMLGADFVLGGRLERLPIPKRTRALPFNDELPAKPLSTAVPQLVAIASLAILAWSAQKPSGSVWADSLSNGWYTSLLNLVSPLLRHTDRLPVANEFANLVATMIVWTVEGYRYGNSRNLLALPSAWAIQSHLFGFYRVAPLYYLSSVLFSSTNTIGRYVGVQPSRSALLATSLLAIVSIAGQRLSFGPATLWAYIPAVIPVLTTIFSVSSRLIKPSAQTPPKDKRSTLEDQLVIYRKKDASILKLVYAVGLSTSLCLSWLGSTTPSHVSQPNDVATFRSVSIHNFYTVANLRKQGYISWIETVFASAALAAGQVSIGPGVTALGLWYWRENVLARLMTE